MGTVGRHPRPAGLRQLLGVRTRAHHHDAVPEADQPNALPPTDVDVPPPQGLLKEAHRFWLHFAPLLAGAKMLTPADEQTLADYCRACYWVETLDRKKRAEWRRKHQDMGLIKTLDAQSRGWIQKKTSLAGELGLTAISRTRTAWSGQRQDGDTKAPSSKVAELQARARSLRRPMPVAKPDKTGVS